MRAPEGDDEFARIARIAAILAHGNGTAPEVLLGIGDDAAVLGIANGERIVWTIDASVDEVHFRREWLSFEDIGFRSTVAAASDLLAMGARPVAALAAWTLPPDLDERAIDAIARGQREAASQLAMPIVGGNLSSGSTLSITTTALGVTLRPIARGGGRVGDRLVVAGALGEAALGLAALRAGVRDAFAIEVWRRPPVLLRIAAELAQVAHAMIDVSDGLAQDVGHLAVASGVGASIDLVRLASRRRSVAGRLAAELGVDLAHLELAGGEDYALVAALPPEVALPPGVDEIGQLVEGRGVSVRAADGSVSMPPTGHRHASRR